MNIAIDYSKLSNEELIKLAKDGNLEAYNYLFERNESFCYYIANKFTKDEQLKDEYVSYAKIGMLKAYNTFDLNKDIKFATYASKCMTNEILMFIRRDVKHRNNCSLEEPINIDFDGNELTILDITSNEENIVSKLLDKETFKEYENFLNTLSNKEKTIVLLLLEGKTQQEIAKQLDFSQSYISRLEKRIKNKLIKFMKKNGSVLEMARTVKGNLELAKQLLKTTKKGIWEISKETGCNYMTVKGWAKKLRKDEEVSNQKNVEPEAPIITYKIPINSTNKTNPTEEKAVSYVESSPENDKTNIEISDEKLPQTIEQNKRGLVSNLSMSFSKENIKLNEMTDEIQKIMEILKLANPENVSFELIVKSIKI